jgi:tetratricopeptide (TPR) repeat protein
MFTAKIIGFKFYLTILFVCLFTWIDVLHASNPQKESALSDSAITYYEKGNYAKAIECYNHILASGKESWLLHFNLGNCYYKNQQLGFAIAHYERGLKLNPESQDLKINLDIVSKKVIDKIKTKDLFIENEIRNYIVYKLSTEHWAWLTVFSLFLSLSFFIIYFKSNSKKYKLFGFWISVTAALIFIFSFVFGNMEVDDKYHLTYAVVTKPEIFLFEQPNQNTKKLTLHDGTRMKILQKSGEWSNIQLSNGNEGWLLSNDICSY